MRLNSRLLAISSRVSAVRGQRGAVLIIFFVALFLTGATVVLTALNNRSPQLSRMLDLQREMLEIKESLLAYSAMFPENYTGQPLGSGPGRLPCPDTDNDGLENCTGSGLGRLPRTVNYNPSGVLGLSILGVSTDQQFWYAVHPNFWRSMTVSAVNSTTATTFTLDGGAADVVALLIAPGDILSGQTRSNSTAANYLEGGNADVPTFFSENNIAPASFNDRVLPIRRGELMTLSTARAAQQSRARLDAFHPGNGNSYPLPAGFAGALAGAAAWFVDDQWGSAIETYLQIDANNFSVKFLNCGITYSASFGNPGFTRSQSTC